MNKTALKNFATWSRRKLIEQVQTKALLYGIDEKNGLHIEEQFGQLLINGQTYPLSMESAFKALQKQLEQKGYKQILEEAAYTWFNRIIAIRFMEVHEYLPERVNVLSSSVGRVDPDILFEYDTMDLTIKHKEISSLINAGNTEAAYRILFVAQCNALNRILPFMFEPIQDFTELLLPDFLLDAESVIKTLVQNEELTESFAEIEVIGWLYQYYIAEEKDRVFAQKSKYKKEEIPFATQLFTPKWIVQYLVQNSLGRYWTEAHREDEDLINNWEYFIKHEEENFYEKIAPYVNKELKVEDIKLLDPAMGSGHILVYAFDVFHEIYMKCGFPKRDIPRLILENNLYGLDIDDRAYQLAAFAVVMKAASYSKLFLRSVEREGIQLNLASIQETNHISNDVIAYIAQQKVGERHFQIKGFFDQYYNAKTYGSLINITERDISFIEERLEQIRNNPVEDLFDEEQHEIAKKVLPVLVHQTKILRNVYEVVVMNPPYLNNKGMNASLSGFLEKYYNESKLDLFAAFMEKSINLAHSTGWVSAITMESWMFLSGFEKLRTKLIGNSTFDSFVHMPYDGKGRTSLGINFGTVAFSLRNIKIEDVQGVYQALRYFEIDDEGLPLAFPIVNEKYNILAQYEFLHLPSKQIAYWANENTLAKFENRSLSDISIPKFGMSVGGGVDFIKNWYEVNINSIGFKYKSSEAFKQSKKKWAPMDKGGPYRKWYGNKLNIVEWGNDGEKIKNNPRAAVRSPQYFFKPHYSWTLMTSGEFSARYFEDGYILDTASNCIYFHANELKPLTLALLNSKVSRVFLDLLNPTMNYSCGVVGQIPILVEENDEIEQLVNRNIEIMKEVWDYNELSWEFKKNPLLLKVTTRLAESFANYVNHIESLKLELQSNEEKINEYFINLYSMNDILTPDVPLDSISIDVPTSKSVARDLLSYFIGCKLGRYSIKDDGIYYAGGDQGASANAVLRSVIMTEVPYFENDIMKLLNEFLVQTFSAEAVDENIEWLADVLEMKKGENAETRIRRYFLDEFFADHCKMYYKRPIYWLIDSGKQKGLRSLIYMHHYQPDTMASIRFEHLQEIQAKYQQEIADLETRLVNANLSASDKKKLNAEKVQFEKKIEELRDFDKRLAEFATAALPIDLDDGVKVNYEKFYCGGKGVLAKIK
ncbi:BREX-1 system adenine-specific DNA-methyltransferase PglX [Solibacillus sp. CAU 1738]|uniref:BREX-1 system adenine-specific DNA-methyltransferase PglX n=1 Tax=Solibacillus sp. CAU 1738 TaxID=3140363 RepID=UPI003260323A